MWGSWERQHHPEGGQGGPWHGPHLVTGRPGVAAMPERAQGEQDVEHVWARNIIEPGNDREQTGPS